MGLLVLAQSDQALSKLWVWIVILLAMVLAGAIVIFSLRRSLLSPKDDPTAHSGSLLGHLQDLHDRGEMSDEEFRAARAKLLGELTDKHHHTDHTDPPDSR